MRFKDLSVRVRLTLGFSFVLLMVIFMAAMGFLRLNDVSIQADIMVKQLLVKERLAEEYAAIVSGNSARTMAGMLTTSPETRSTIIESFSKDVKRAEDIQQYLRNNIHTEHGEKLLRNVATVQAEYHMLREKGFKMSTTVSEKEMDRFIDEEWVPLTQKYSQAVTELSLYQQKLIDDSYVRIVAAENSGKLMLLICSVSAVLAGYLIASLIARSITVPLSSAVSIAQEVASGNLTVDIAIDSKDQLGQLKEALRDMTASLHTVTEKMGNGAQSIAQASSEILNGNQDLADKTDVQAASVRQTAATLEELSSTIEGTAEHTARMHTFMSESGGIVRRNGDLMSEAHFPHGFDLCLFGKNGEHYWRD
ncbi:methyl-accepting chemotaxis protein [Dryocola sp. BD586]|uniref:methyl-accepting chemotaxis protein n=1 Tax=Dryocola sp. BD586 TaxID=3133271 RepID=UPI003F50BC57